MALARIVKPPTSYTHASAGTYRFRFGDRPADCEKVSSVAGRQ